MLPYPETTSGEDLQDAADYFRQQAHRHAARGDRNNADVCYQAAETADTLRRRLTEPRPARRQPETSAERLFKHPRQAPQRAVHRHKPQSAGHGFPPTQEKSP